MLESKDHKQILRSSGALDLTFASRARGWVASVKSAPLGGHGLDSWRLNVREQGGGGLLVAAVLAFIASAAWGEEDFPISGTYTKDASCEGETAQREDLRVRIAGNTI